MPLYYVIQYVKDRSCYRLVLELCVQAKIYIYIYKKKAVLPKIPCYLFLASLCNLPFLHITSKPSLKHLAFVCLLKSNILFQAGIK